jgi:hypothetical protein
VNSYVIRVYRQEKNNPRLLVGTVEKVGQRGRSAFTNMDELWEIVDEGAGRAKAKGAGVWERQKGRKPKQGTTETGDHKPEANQGEAM